jgi:hypothetical protein
MGVLMARVNYQRDKRLKDLDRQRKQEEKRNKKLLKDLNPEANAEGAPVEEQEGPAQPEVPAV